MEAALSRSGSGQDRAFRPFSFSSASPSRSTTTTCSKCWAIAPAAASPPMPAPTTMACLPIREDAIASSPVCTEKNLTYRDHSGLWQPVETSRVGGAWLRPSAWLNVSLRHLGSDGTAISGKSAKGQTRRFRDVRGMSGLPPTADISGPGRHFAFGPTTDIPAPAGRSIRPIAPPLNPLALAREGLVLGHDSQSL